MKERNKNKLGYKKTNVGWVPQSWDFTHLAEMVEEHNAGIYKKRELYGSGNNIVGVSDLYGISRIDGQKFRQVPLTQKDLEKYMLHEGDLIYGESSLIREGIARTLYVTKNGVGTAFAWHTRRYKINKNKICSNYLYYFLESYQARKFMVSNSTQTALTGITTDDYFRCPIPIPPLLEQKKIADIFSTWDEAIEQTRKLIDAKKHRKKALMQQLLTGKKRLPGFRESWKEYHLGELFHERRETNCEYLPLLAITGKNGIIPASDIERKDSSSTDKSRYKRIAPGDIGYNTMRMWQGVSAVARSEGIVSPAYTICIPNNDVDVDFMGYLFKLPNIIHLFWRFSQGLVNDTLNLKFHNFSKIRIKIPPEDEQRRIADVLSAADDEIKALEQKLSALGKQKRGLMQKLLTGEVRVKL